MRTKFMDYMKKRKENKRRDLGDFSPHDIYQYSMPTKKMVSILGPDDSSYRYIRDQAVKASKGSLQSPFRDCMPQPEEKKEISSDTLNSKDKVLTGNVSSKHLSLNDSRDSINDQEDQLVYYSKDPRTSSSPIFVNRSSSDTKMSGGQAV